MSASLPTITQRSWRFLLYLGIVLLLLEPFAASFLKTFVSEKQAQSAAEHSRLLQEKDRWDEDMLLASTWQGDDAMLHAIMQQTDLAHALNALEALASLSRLYHFTHTLSPLEPWSENNLYRTDGLVAGHLTLEADAPSDIEVMNFLGRLDELSGGLRLEQLSLKPIAADPNAPLASLNLHMSATFQWIMNAPSAQGAGAP